MNKNKECKIVQDLLPSYMDKVTNKITSEFIENHIANCQECKQILKDMNAEIVLDKVNEKKEIDYLKKVRNRNLIILLFAIICILIVVSVNVAFCNDVKAIKVKEDGSLDYFGTFIEWITGKNVIHETEVTNILAIYNEEGHDIYYSEDMGDYIDDGKNYNKTSTFIFTFDKNTDICIGTRYCLEGFSEGGLQERYKQIVKEQENKAMEDVRIENGKLIYSFNYYTGKTKEEILDKVKDADKLIEF